MNKPEKRPGWAHIIVKVQFPRKEHGDFYFKSRAYSHLSYFLSSEMCP